MGIFSFFTCPAALSRAKAEHQQALDAKAASDILLAQLREALQQLQADFRHYQSEASAEKQSLQHKLNLYEATELPELIRQRASLLRKTLPFSAVGRPWSQCLTALRETFNEPAETEEWEWERVVGQMVSAYPSLLSTAVSDPIFFVPRHRDDVIRLVDATWVRWMPSKANLWDCDDYAAAFKVEMALLGVTSCAEVWGLSPEGHHAYNLIACADGLVIADMTSMQRCATVPPGMQGYQPRDIKKL